MPVFAGIVAAIAVPVAIYLHVIELSQKFLIHYFFQPNRRRRIAVLHHAKHIFMLFERFEYDFFGVGFAECDRFFDYDV